jgi:hypothetical protein
MVARVEGAIIHDSIAVAELIQHLVELAHAMQVLRRLAQRLRIENATLMIVPYTCV